MVEYRCACGSLVRFDTDEGDCEDDEIQCPKCNRFTPVTEIRKQMRHVLAERDGGR